MKLSARNSTFLSHFAWYFSGALIPLLINFVKTPIFTRHYAAEDFGVLGLVMISFGYLTSLGFSWIRSCMWRFYPKYKKQNRLATLYSNLMFVYVLSMVVVVIITWIAMQFFESETLAYRLIPIAAAHYILHELLGLYYIVIRLQGEAKRYNFLVAMQVALSFGLLLLLAFVGGWDISAMLWCYLIVDVVFLLLLLFKLLKDKKRIPLAISKINRLELRVLASFGGVSLMAAFFLMLIVSSDRYIIALYESMTNVGIYSKTYDVAQMSIMALVFIFFNTVNPSMNKVLEENKELAKEFLFKYIYAFTFLIFPIVFLASIFRKEITQILLGEEFQSGSELMPYIFFSMLIFGVINFYENEYKFSHRLRKMTLFFGLGFLLNLILNFILIPRFGMMWAAITTLMSYLFILLLFLKNDHYITQLKNAKYQPFIWMLLTMFILLLIDTLCRHFFEFNLVYGIIEAVIFIMITIGLFWKDVRNLEIPMLV